MNTETNPPSQSCESFEIAISAMLDGELSGPEKDELGRHLLACAQCRQLTRRFESLNHHLEQLNHPPIVTVRQPSKRSWFSKRLIVGIASAVAICLVVIVWPSNTALNAGQVTAEQIIQPMQQLHQVTVQRQQSHDTELRVMKMDLQLLQLQLRMLEKSQQETQLNERLQQLLERVNDQQLAMQEFEI